MNIHSNEKEHKNLNIIQIILMIFTVGYLFIAPYYKGLFNGTSIIFERPIYTTIAWMSIALFFVSIVLYTKWKIRNYKDLMVVIIWFIPLSYLISMINAASFHSAKIALLIAIICTVFFIIGYMLSNIKAANKILIYAILASGYLLVIFGIFNWFGVLHYQDAVLNGRLSNVFQYPNSFAAYLVGILLSSVWITSNVRRTSSLVFFSFLYFLTSLSFLLTLSRGGFLIFFIIFVFYLLLVPLRNQLESILFTIVTFGGSLLILAKVVEFNSKLADQFNSAIFLKASIYVLVAGIFVSIAMVFIRKFKVLDSFMKRVEEYYGNYKPRFILPIIIIVISFVSVITVFNNQSITERLPSNLGDRIQDIQENPSGVFQRNSYYEDSFNIISDNIWIGTGGGGWAALYEKYKSYPYIGRQTHNYYLGYMIDVGVISFIILIFFLLIVNFVFLKWFLSNKRGGSSWLNLVYFNVSASILLHSIIDFNMSYVYLASLVFLCMGAMIKTDHVPNSKKDRSNKWYKLYPALASVLSIVLFAYSVQLLSGNSMFNKAVSSANSFQERLLLLDSALAKEPFHPGYVDAKVSMLLSAYNSQKEDYLLDTADELIERIKEKEPYNYSVLEKEYFLHMFRGEFQVAHQLLDSNLDNFPWNIDIYQKIIHLSFELGIRDHQNRDLHWDEALQNFELLVKKVNEVEILPDVLTLGTNFKVTPDISLTIGKIYFLRDEYSKAASVFNSEIPELTNFNEEITRELGRWYLASLRKQNQNDDELYHRLINKEPNERELIDQLVNM